ncbi:tetratricopeptide repeat protein 29 isoform X1 [Canis lupus familiaris]|uniref:Tetratricopeptide repeat protein 29 n=1 Tax=Canis lupus familiaris TaxID=9615 RepID=A0A8C0Q8X5_CANLF|nr:tetratricopeptide repeat protein 29 isoform X1 [Canis lupus familiaris]XP_038414877.1 tetratricopeptide repeat protein 29 isoform X1 [Canis lupus familiaris]XP_038414878.1 tetratricopeptide repeat protein 29 isoform X1 [Canis lupus familiaris]XP_539755.3 tetratricopeptide repeat protein 29 isoform X1 [Canis lupus familiaris]|eukprot:XP_022259185.1 tetratricopeptide repeat protein 29 isoform X1 [Canis lupus familiaris]
MTTLPPLPVIRPKLTSLARKKLPCSPSTIPRSQLIKEKDDIDHYLEVNFKGLSKEEVAAYRNSYKKNICVDMLRDGYHKSFTELFALMKKWDALQETARVRSLSWLQRPLEEQPDKLDHFYHYLTRAEAAERKEYFEDVYNNLYALACYFNNSEDKWVRNHFYERCFKIAQLIKIDGGKKEAEAHAHMGLLFEEEGQLLEAAEHYEAFHQLTEGRIWKDETGRFLSLLACESLLRTYKLLSDKMLENKEYKQAIRILIKASEIAKEGSDKKMEGEASYYLGLAHLAAGEYETALTVFNTYSKISTDLDDDLSLGRAYEAIAKVLQSQGEMTEAIKYLKKVVKIARKNFQSLDVVRASTMLGAIYNEKGYYNKASEYFQQAFDTTAELTNLRQMDETKVHYGIAKAHQIMPRVNNYIESADLTSLDFLLSWKESRSKIACEPTMGGSRRSTRESLCQIPENLEEELSGFPDNQKTET